MAHKLYVWMKGDSFMHNFSLEEKDWKQGWESWENKGVWAPGYLVNQSGFVPVPKVWTLDKIYFTYELAAISGNKVKRAMFSSVWGEDDYRTLVAKLKKLASAADETWISGPVGKKKLYNDLKGTMHCGFHYQENSETYYVDKKPPEEFWQVFRTQWYPQDVKPRTYQSYKIEEFDSGRLLLLKPGYTQVLPFTYKWEEDIAP